ncbi:MAG: hypothetical protein V4448_11990 [Pseudomonadota bacterium]
MVLISKVGHARALGICLSVSLLFGCGNDDKKPNADAGAPKLTSSAEATDNGRITIPRRSNQNQYLLIDFSKNGYTLPEYEILRQMTRDMYWSAAPKDLKNLAWDYLPTYRREANTFKQEDVLKANEADLEKKFEQARTNKNYAVRVKQTMLAWPYDPEKKGFRIVLNPRMETEGMRMEKDDKNNDGEWNVTAIGLPVNYSYEMFFKPKNTDEARAIEEVLAPQRRDTDSNVSLYLQYEGSVIGTRGDTRDTKIVLGVDNITAVDQKTGKPVFTITSEALGKKIEVNERLNREMLGLPEPEQRGYLPM